MSTIVDKCRQMVGFPKAQRYNNYIGTLASNRERGAIHMKSTEYKQAIIEIVQKINSEKILRKIYLFVVVLSGGGR